MKLTVEYWNNEARAWKVSRAGWSFEDVAFLNKTVGYEKYRVARVTV